MLPDQWYVRDPAVVAASRGDRFLFLSPDRSPVVIRDLDAEALASLLARTAVPTPGHVLAEMCSPEALDLLVEHGVLWRGDEAALADRLPRPRSAGPRRCRRAVVGISGAISAAGMLAEVINIADHLADEVDVVLTEAATRFVQPAVFEYWGLRTWLDPFEPRHGATVPHIHLATRADLVLIAPASASTLHRLASGSCSDLLSLVVAATAAPVAVAPVMNGRMWRSLAVSRNVAQLRADGIWIIEPGLGFEVSDRGQAGDVGGAGYGRSPGGLVRALGAILDLHAEARAPG